MLSDSYSKRRKEQLIFLLLFPEGDGSLVLSATTTFSFHHYHDCIHSITLDVFSPGWGCGCTSHFSYKCVDQRIISPIQHDLCCSLPLCAHFPLELYILFSGCVVLFFLWKKEVMGGGFTGVSWGSGWLQPCPRVGNSCSTSQWEMPSLLASIWATSWIPGSWSTKIIMNYLICQNMVITLHLNKNLSWFSLQGSGLGSEVWMLKFAWCAVVYFFFLTAMNRWKKIFKITYL